MDKISLVAAPYVGGEADKKTSFDTLGTFVPQKFVFEKAVKLDDGVQLLFVKEKAV